jgi:pimeloyl-ACP methyl ester carboxylesterase
LEHEEDDVQVRDIVRVGDVDICVETFGRWSDPAVLLIGGAARSMDWWEDEFCARLAASRFVVRYDHRDTGRSTSYPPGSPGYAFDDLVGDIVGLLGTLGLARAHLVGISMGGQIGQLAAVNHPARVASLTLIATNPGQDTPDLPPMSGRLSAHFAGAVPPEWSDRAAVIDHIVALDHAFAAEWPADEEAVSRERAGRVVDRTVCIASALTNHWVMESGVHWRPGLRTLTIPTLVIHGTEDPLFPLAHGLALAADIPGATLLRLPRTGHELPQRTWDTVIPAIVRNTAEIDPGDRE